MSAAAPRLRLLLLYDCLYPDTIGGVEHRNLELGRALVGRGHLVTLAGFGSTADSPVPGLIRQLLGPTRSLHDQRGRRRTTDAVTYAAAVGRLDLTAYSMVETASLPFAHLPLLAMRCRAAGLPLVVSWYEHWGKYWKTYLARWSWPLFAVCERLCSPIGRLALCSSMLTADRLRKRRRGASAVLPVGIDTKAIAIAAAGGLPGASLLYAGRLIPEKRIDLLLRAVALLPGGADLPVLDIIGEGPDRPRLEHLVGELGLASRVRFLGRFTSSADVWRALGGARVAVQPSGREGFGIFPLEAMAAGLPTVYCTSSESAVAELVRDRVEGLAAAPAPAALAQTLEELLTNPDLHGRLSSAAKQRAADFDWAQVAQQFESTVRPLLKAAQVKSR